MARSWATTSAFGLAADLAEPLLLKHGHLIRIGSRQLALGEYLFARYGGAIVFWGRFVALLRVYAAILAGTNRLPPLHFAIYNAAGGLVWATIFGLGGFLVGKNVEYFLGPIGWVALASFAVAGILIVVLLQKP